MSSEIEDPNIWHIHPVGDLKPHTLEGIECECNPEIRKEDGFTLVIHNAYDRRERLEAYNMGRINNPN